MNLSTKQMEQARQAATPEELMALAGAWGIPLTAEEAGASFAVLHPPAGELADAELDNVAGGGCGGGGGSSGPSGFMAKGYQFMPCPQCGYNYWSIKTSTSYAFNEIRYIWECDVCYHRAKKKGGGEVPTHTTTYDASKIETPREAWIDG